jgi:hypothetical protein
MDGVNERSCCLGSMESSQAHPQIRLALLLGFGLAIVLVGVTLLRYPGNGQTATQYLGLGLAAIIALLVAGLILGLPGTRTRSAEGARILHNGVTLGGILGLLWVLEINYNNIFTPPVSLRDPVDNVFWAVIALAILVQAFLTAFRTRHFLRGVQAGFWSGTVSGLVACLMGLVLVVFLLRLVTNDPVSVQEWNELGKASGAPDIATYFTYETLAGALLHLFGLGVIMGILLGVIGGVLGRAAAVIFRNAAH